MKTSASFLFLLAIFFQAVTYSQNSAESKGVVNRRLFTDPETGKQIPLFDKSYALIIGNHNYLFWSDLDAVPLECRRLADALNWLGFDTIIRFNRTRTQMMNDVEDFIKKYGKYGKTGVNNNRLLIYYSGHGYLTQDQGITQGFTLPVGAPRFEMRKDIEKMDPANTVFQQYKEKQGQFESASVGYDQWKTWAGQIKARHTLFVFDCCFSGQLLTKAETIPATILEAVESPSVEFMTAGNAMETVPGESYYLKYFLLAISGKDRTADLDRNGYLTTGELHNYLYKNVKLVSQNDPLKGKLPDPRLLGEFVFVLPAPGTVVPPTPPTVSGTADPVDTIPPVASDILPPMVFIPGGSFMMGSNDGETNEKPIHPVTLSSFYMGKFEITVRQFRQFINETGYRTDAETGNGSYIYIIADWKQTAGVNWRFDAQGFKRPESEYDHPVIHVSWNDANEYCRWLSKKTGKRYRLPTEAEWEYAAGNGRKHTKYSWGNEPPRGKNGGNVADKAAEREFPAWWIFEDYDDGYVYTAPVGRFQPNGFGLYDMTGNVWEWCSDGYSADYYANSPAENPDGLSTPISDRVYRGGGWIYDPTNCRTSYRIGTVANHRNSHVGFRVVSVP